MKTPLLIFPFNGNGLEALDCISEEFEFIGFVDDTPEKQGRHRAGFEVHDRSALKKFPDAKVLAVPGSPASYQIRNEIIAKLGIPEERFATVIHPAACISPLASIGKNVLIMAGVVVTSNAVIADHVCILPNTVLHHDVVIGEYTLIGSGVTIAGSTAIGSKCYIGSGSRFINNISIGDKTLVGLGSNVIRSFKTGSKLVGNPAKNIA